MVFWILGSHFDEGQDTKCFQFVRRELIHKLLV